MSVFWTNGKKQVGLAMQDGIIVVRPGWVAFLPTEAAVNAAAMTGFALAGGIRLTDKKTTTYPLDQWLAEGEDTFDRLVTEAARVTGGFLLTPSNGQVIKGKRSARICWDEESGKQGLLRFFGAPAPLPLLRAWPRGEERVDLRSLAIVATVISLYPLAGASFCAYCYLSGSDGPEILWGVAGWGALFTIVWAAVAATVRKASRPTRRPKAHGPYRTA